MAKAQLCHIPLSLRNLRAAVDYFINAFGREEVGGTGRGTINGLMEC